MGAPPFPQEVAGNTWEAVQGTGAGPTNLTSFGLDFFFVCFLQRSDSDA